MSSSRLQLGSVVWAELEDANGFRKVRPAVVVSAMADITAGQPVRVAAITTRVPRPLPEGHVLLPWDPTGKARSGLRRKCAAVADWLAEVAVADVKQVVGLLPPAVIAELLSKIAPAGPAGGAPPDNSSAPPPDGPSPEGGQDNSLPGGN